MNWEPETRRFIFALIIVFLACLAVINSIPAAAYYDKEYQTDEIMEQVVLLALCETDYTSNAYAEHDPITPSIGLLQFKTETFNHFSNYYGFQELDIWNPEHQKLLAYKMIKEGRYSHWLTCSREYGFID